MLNAKKQNILELDRNELIGWLGRRQIESYRADQILKWIYLRQADRFDLMTDIAKDIRPLLEDYFTISRICLNWKMESGLKVSLYRSAIIIPSAFPARRAVLWTAGFA
jgi:adenine C2-methylase RlmN of 23S rRNA A2503 and tRNA A37